MGGGVDLEGGVEMFDDMVLRVVRHLLGAQLPERRLRRILAAEVAGGIDAAPQLEPGATGAPPGIGGEARAVGEQGADVLQEAVLKAVVYFFFSSRRRHTRSLCDWSSDVCSSD